VDHGYNNFDVHRGLVRILGSDTEQEEISMKKSDIEIYYERGFRSGRPSINVKNFNFAQGLTSEKLGCSEETFEKACNYAFESAQRIFWEDAQETAAHYLGKGIKVFPAGKSGGHLIVNGLDPVETWDAITVSAWGRFEKAILADIKYRCEAEQVEEDIRSNRWNEEGAEEYNFFEKKDGSTICISELKAQAIKEGFEPVIRK
jgi:hypothetical protein